MNNQLLDPIIVNRIQHQILSRVTLQRISFSQTKEIIEIVLKAQQRISNLNWYILGLVYLGLTIFNLYLTLEIPCK